MTATIPTATGHPAPAAPDRRALVMPVGGLSTTLAVLLALDAVLLVASLKPAFVLRDLLAALPAGTTSVEFTNPPDPIGHWFALVLAAVAVTVGAAITAIVWAVRVHANAREFRALQPAASRRVRPIAVVWGVAVAAWIAVWASYGNAADVPSQASAVVVLPAVGAVVAAVSAVAVRRIGKDQDAQVSAELQRHYRR